MLYAIPSRRNEVSSAHSRLLVRILHLHPLRMLRPFAVLQADTWECTPSTVWFLIRIIRNSFKFTLVYSSRLVAWWSPGCYHACKRGGCLGRSRKRGILCKRKNVVGWDLPFPFEDGSCLTVSGSAGRRNKESVLAGDYSMTAAFIIVHTSPGTG